VLRVLLLAPSSGKSFDEAIGQKIPEHLDSCRAGAAGRPVSRKRTSRTIHCTEKIRGAQRSIVQDAVTPEMCLFYLHSKIRLTLDLAAPSIANGAQRHSARMKAGNGHRRPAQLTNLRGLESAPAIRAPILLPLNRMKYEPASSVALYVSARRVPRRLLGAVDQLHPAGVNQQRDRRYA
jgi:hypothetical protein